MGLSWTRSPYTLENARATYVCCEGGDHPAHMLVWVRWRLCDLAFGSLLMITLPFSTPAFENPSGRRCLAYLPQPSAIHHTSALPLPIPDRTTSLHSPAHSSAGVASTSLSSTMVCPHTTARRFTLILLNFPSGLLPPALFVLHFQPLPLLTSLPPHSPSRTPQQ